MISVLCVDDDPSLLDLTRIYLEKNGDFSVETTESALQALGLVKARHFDAIVSDYQMPGMNGIEFLTALRRDFPQLPFIIFTGKGREDVVIEAFERGADFYLQKGGDPRSQFAELAHKIQSAVRLRQEKEARCQSEARFRALIENSTDIIRILDKNGTIIFDSGASERILGYPPCSIIGKSPFEFIHPDDHQTVRNALEEVLRKTNPGTPTEFRVRKSDGSYIWVESIANNLLGMPGIDGIVVITRSIDERKAAEAAIREREEALITSEENYRCLFEHAIEGILVVKGDRIVHFNPALEKILGCSREEILSRPVWEFIHPEDREMVRTRHTRRTRGESPPTGYRFRIIGGDGKERLLWINSTLVTWSGEPANLSFINDITEQWEVTRTRDRFGRILERSLNEIYIFDARTLKFLFVNHGARKNLGYTMDELYLMTPIDLKREFTRESFEERIAPLRKGELTELQFFSAHRRKDGTIYNVEVHLEYLANENPPVFVAIILDITNRLLIEEELKKKEVQYRLIAENSAECIWIADLDLKFTYVSPAIERLRGVSAEKALSQRLEDFMPAESISRIYALLEEELAVERNGTGDPNRSRVIEIEEFLPDGTRIWVSNTLTFLRDAEGRPEAILGISRDITEIKRTMEALRESEQKYSALFKHNISVSLLIDPDTGNIVDANDAAVKYYGYPRDSLVGMGIENLNRLPREKVLRDLARAKKERDKRFFSTHYLSDGSVRNVEVYSGPITIKGKQLFYSIIHDITARKTAEAALYRANRQMKLLTTITRHDIQNTLMVAEGYLALMEDEPGENASQMMEKLRQSLKKIMRQIQFTREFESLGSGDPVWQNVNDVISSLDIPPSVTLQKAGCSVEVLADPMLGKVFENLLDNSIRHGGPGMDRILLTCGPDEQDLLITWEDSGEGIAMKDKMMIFEWGVGRGTGLGLFLAREILGITGITIRETGIPGKGARFEMRVPAGLYRRATTQI